MSLAPASVVQTLTRTTKTLAQGSWFVLRPSGEGSLKGHTLDALSKRNTGERGGQIASRRGSRKMLVIAPKLPFSIIGSLARANFRAGWYIVMR
jgi:hypothetical protein